MVIRELLQRFQPVVKLLKRTVVVFLICAISFTVFPVVNITQPPNAVLGWMKDSLATQVLLSMEQALVPKGVTLIVIGPFDAFNAIMEMGVYLAAVVTLPYFVAGLLHWLSPALKGKEKKAVYPIVYMSTALFFAGFFIMYFVILPYIYTFSYTLNPAVGTTETLSLLSFIDTTFMFLIGFGLVFEIPSICLGLSYVGILSSNTMLEKYNWAGIACFVVAFIISPGVGGGTIELLMGLGFYGLYWIAYYLVKHVEVQKRAAVRTFVID